MQMILKDAMLLIISISVSNAVNGSTSNSTRSSVVCGSKKDNQNYSNNLKYNCSKMSADLIPC